MNPQQLQDGQNGPLPPAQNNPQPPQNAAPAQAYPAPPAATPLDSTPYDFIMNPQQSAKKPLVALGGGSMVKRVAIAVAALSVLIIIAILATSVIGGGGGVNKASMITVAQEQTELLRIAKQGAEHGVSQKTQSIAYNVQLSVESANTQLLAYLKQNGQKIAPKTLALKHNTQTDTAFTAALTNSTFDTTFNDVLRRDLTSYIQSLKTAFNDSSGTKGKALLNTQYAAATLLLEQTKL